MPSFFSSRAFACSKFVPVIPALAFAIVCANVLATELPLTLAAAQQLAVAHSRQLPAQELTAVAAREMAIAAAQLPDPVLKAGIDNLPVSGSDRFSLNNDFMTMRRIGVMQELTRADKRVLRAERYLKEAEKSVAEKAATTATIQKETALAWLDRFYTEEMAKVVDAQAMQARQEIQAAEGAYRGGRGSQADVFAARGALASVEDRESEIARRVRNAQVRLARWTGAAGDAPLAGRPALDKIRLDPTTLETELRHHPQVGVLLKREEMAATEARLAQANKRADWSVEVAYQQRGPAYSNMVSVGISLPLQWDQKNRQDRELSARLASVDQTRAELEETLREHIAETRAMINEWDNGRERSVRYERELVPLARQRTDAVLAAWRGGKATLTDVLSARRSELDVRLQALQLQAETARLWAQLNFLIPEAAAVPAMAPSRQSMDTK